MASKLSSDLRRLKVSDRDASIADFYPLRMTADHRTEMHVKFAKVMLIFQGPGTEKRSAAIAELISKFKYAGRLVSDETYKRETGRMFSSETIEYFYSYFKSRVKKSCEEGYNLIIIDQSMNNAIQMKYYFFLAQTMQYLILPYPPLIETPYDNFSKKQTQASAFRADSGAVVHENLFKHLFFGWFLHDVDSAELREEAGLYVRDCFDNIFEFRELFSKICQPCDFGLHYNMINKRQNLAFCTVKIPHNLLDVKNYLSSSTFKRFYGSMSKLYIVGFIISPHMIAARVKLTFEQKKLWEMQDDLDERYKVTVFPSELLNSSEVKLPDKDVKLIASKSNRTLITGESIDKPTEAIHSQAKGRSCHILLGKVKDAPLRNVDYDVPFAVHRENTMVPKNSKDFEPYELERCLVRRIGKYWFIYLKESLIVNGLFATCCSLDNQNSTKHK